MTVDWIRMEVIWGEFEYIYIRSGPDVQVADMVAVPTCIVINLTTNKNKVFAAVVPEKVDFEPLLVRHACCAHHDGGLG